LTETIQSEENIRKGLKKKMNSISETNGTTLSVPTGMGNLGREQRQKRVRNIVKDYYYSLLKSGVKQRIDPRSSI
jgi:hypothetical protein